MEKRTPDNGEIIQQFDELIRDGRTSDKQSQMLLGSLSGLFDLYKENRNLRKIYSQVHHIIGNLVELDKGKELGSILLQIATAARSLLESDNIVIIPTTPDGDTFIPRYSTVVGQGRKHFKIPAKPRPKGVTAYLISSPSGLIHIKDCSDLKTYPFLDSRSDSFLGKAGIKSFLGLRLGNKARIYGFFYINRISLTEFTEDQIKLAELLGALISIALQLHTSIETLIQPVHTEALQKIQQAINIVTNSEEETDLQGFLFNLLDTALQITGVKEDGFGFVGLVDKVENILRIYAHVGPQDEKETLSILLGREDESPQGITGWVAKTGQPALVNDVRQDERYIEIFNRNTISELAVPLRVKAGVIGVINLESSKDQAFSENDLALLEGLANLASIAIHVIRRRKAQHDDSTFANVIIASLDATETLNRFYDYVHARTQARDMAILSYDVDQNVFRLDEFPVRASAHANKILVIPFGEGLSGNAAKHDKIIYIPDIMKLVEGDREYISWLDDTRANMAIPLKIGHRLIGILNIESPIPYAFDDVDEDQLQIMSSFAAISLENARRYQNTVNFQTSSTFVELFVSRFHDLFGNTIKPAAVKLEGLEIKLLEKKSTRSSDQLLNGLSQELKAIREIIDQGIRDAHDLATSASETNRIASYLEHKENYSFDEGINLALKQVNIPSNIQMIRNYRDDVASTLVPGPIHDVFRNLFKNSLDAINKIGGAGTISVSAQQRLGWLYIVVNDTGRGIPDEDIDKVFEIGYSVGGRGLGLGLHVTRGLVELFGGKLVIKNNKPGKMTFAFSWPTVDNGS
jgi:GAF domain-containing protein